MPRATKRACLGRCGALVTQGTSRCPECQQKAEKARGSRYARGYDRDFDRARVALYAQVVRMERRLTPMLCPVCGLPMLPARGQKLDLGHLVPLIVNPSSREWAMVHRQCNPRGRSPHNMGT